MMIMPSNNTSGLIHYLAGRYPNQIGLLISPQSTNYPPEYMQYAIDNGCFVKWEEERFYGLLKRMSLRHKPLWVVVPDVVGDREKTLEMWHEHKDRVAEYGYRLAFACQDGMTKEDVPKEAYCAFIGGTLEWKLANAHKFKFCEWLHIGRVGTLNKILWARDEVGADSVDSTAFFRDKDKRHTDFKEYFLGKKQKELFNGL